MEDNNIAPIPLSGDDNSGLMPINNLIHVIRGQQVMIDSDLAQLYGVETKRLKEQVKRNINRFPSDFMFELTKAELSGLRSQIATSNQQAQRGGNRYTPFAFTENGVAMLSSILKSEQAIEVNIRIMRAFTAMRSFLMSNARMFQRLETISCSCRSICLKTTRKLKRSLHALRIKQLSRLRDFSLKDKYSMPIRLSRI